MPAERKAGTRPMKSERTHEENQERAYIAASRRSDRSLEARVESARRASEIHKKRTGKALRITEKDVMNEEMYEEEDDEIPRISYRNTMGIYPNYPTPEARLHGFLSYQMMVQQAMGQYGDKGFQNYHLTNPSIYNPCSFDSTMYAPIQYQNIHHQQFGSQAKVPVNPQMMNRFHPYAKPGYVQKRPYSNTPSPIVGPKYQPAPQATYQTPTPQQLAGSSVLLPSVSPQKTQPFSPATSQASNQSPQNQARTPTLTTSSGGSTPAHTSLHALSPLTTSPIVSESQPSPDTYNANPLSTKFSADVATFMKQPYLNDALSLAYTFPSDLDSAKPIDIVSTTLTAIDQPSFSFSDLFDSSMFQGHNSLSNPKNNDLLQTTIDGSGFSGLNFDADALLGLGPNSISQNGSENPEEFHQFKANATGSNTDFSELWSFDDNTWQLGTEFNTLES